MAIELPATVLEAIGRKCDRCHGCGIIDGAVVVPEMAGPFDMSALFLLSAAEGKQTRAMHSRIKPGTGGGNAACPPKYETVYSEPCPECGGNVTISRAALKAIVGRK